MKAFFLGDDRQHVWFQNLDRFPLDVELQNVIIELKSHGCKVGKKEELGTADIYSCKIGSYTFDLCYDETSDGVSLFVKDAEILRELEYIFEFIE